MRDGWPGISFDRLTVGLMFTALAFTACLIPAQTDTFWHLRAGQDIWRTGHISLVETYSHTAAGRPWPDHEWLWQALSYGLYRVGGMPLLTAGCAVVVIGAATIVFRLMVGSTRTRFVLVLLALPLASLAWALRPQTLSLLSLAILLWALVHDRYIALPPLFVVWANAHGGVALGGYILAVACATAVLRAWRGGAGDRRRAVALALLVPACALACAATPLGFGIYGFVRLLEWRVRQVHISEWAPLRPTSPMEIAFCVLAAAFLVVLVRRRRALWAGTWPDWVTVATVVAILPLAFRAVRNVGPFMLLAPVAASRLLAAGRTARALPAGPGADHPRLNAIIFGLLAAGTAVTVGRMWAAPPKALGWRPLSDAAVAAVRACPDPLYNHYDQGGLLIWFVPEKRVFVDSRQDPYPLPLLIEHVRVESAAAPYKPLLDRYGIRCAFLSVESPTARGLERDGWPVRFRDDTWVVLTAPGMQAHPAGAGTRASP